MIKTLKNLLKQDKERYTVPRKVQDVIPVRRIWKDGIFQVGSRFSKTYQFTDINYLVASREDKEQMFLAYSELLNSLDSGATTKITINNRRLNRANFEQSILMPMRGDACDVYRREYNRSMWSAVLYGIYSGDDAIVTVALSQIGNVGGQPYWSWYGFNSRVEWCACFVSWCANKCGYIDSGVIPKFAGCVNGVQWFKDRGQWQDSSFEPSAGQIIFFDWDNKGSSGPQDGQSDHVGIVEKCENGIVYTIEGNSGDSCRQRQYPVGYYEILGYGIPE